MLSPAGRCCALTGLLMTSDFDPDGGVKLRTFSPSISGIAAASHLHESQGKNSCFFAKSAPTRPQNGPMRKGAPAAGAAPPTPPPPRGQPIVTWSCPPRPAAQGWAGARDPDRPWGGPRAAKDPPWVAGPGGGGWRE